jgi:hypothetical protein
MEPRTGRVELMSWKEIASYLGCSVKTAQIWEQKRGLPIRRLPGPRGPVSAVVPELDAWKASTAVLASRRWWLSSRSAAIGLAIFVVASGIAAGLFVRGPSVPSSFRVEENSLVVFGSDGHEIWRKRFAAVLSLEAYLPSSLEVTPRSWFGDLRGDGTQQMLFVMKPRGGMGTSILYCFDNNGRELWHFVPGRSIRTRKDAFVSQYGIDQFAVGRLGRSGRLGIAVSSYHYLFYPTQVALLSPDGKMLTEYWHAGHLGHMVLGDPGGEGYNKIYLGGINNARRAATLVVLDPENFGGASTEEDADYQFEGFPRGREMGRVLFPRTCINRQMERYNGVANLFIQRGTITVDVHERVGPVPRYVNVLYDLTPRLEVQSVTLGDAFIPHHALLRKSGDLDHTFSSSELSPLYELNVITPMQ